MSNTGRPVMADVEYAKAMARSRPRSIGRFVDGRFGLDRILQANAAEPEAIQAISKERVERLRAERQAEFTRVDEARARR
jgi:hypothetical protein